MSYVNDDISTYPDLSSAMISISGIIFFIITSCLLIIATYSCIIMCNEECNINNINEEETSDSESL